MQNDFFLLNPFLNVFSTGAFSVIENWVMPSPQGLKRGFGGGGGLKEVTLENDHQILTMDNI